MIEEGPLTRTFEMLVERLSELEATTRRLADGMDRLSAEQSRLARAAQLSAQRAVRIRSESGLHCVFRDAIAGERVVPKVDVNMYGLEDGEMHSFDACLVASVFVPCPGNWSDNVDEYLSKMENNFVATAKSPVQGLYVFGPSDAYGGMLELRLVTPEADTRALWWDEWVDAAAGIVDSLMPLGDEVFVILDPGHGYDDWLLATCV